MSETAEEIIETQKGNEAAILVRTFDTALSVAGDGRTIEGLVVPYNVKARVSDHGVGIAYDESFAPGAFRAATGAPNRVLLDFEHYGAQFDAVGSMGSLSGTLGWAEAFEETPEGLIGRFRVGSHQDGDKALELVHAGVVKAFSVAFKSLKSLRTPDGAMQRVRAHLDRVSLCREGAYPQAQVLAVRTAPAVEETEMPLRFDSQLAEGLARWFQVPDLLLRTEDQENDQPDE